MVTTTRMLEGRVHFYPEKFSIQKFQHFISRKFQQSCSQKFQQFQCQNFNRSPAAIFNSSVWKFQHLQIGNEDPLEFSFEVTNKTFYFERYVHADLQCMKNANGSKHYTRIIINFVKFLSSIIRHLIHQYADKYHGICPKFWKKISILIIDDSRMIMWWS